MQHYCTAEELLAAGIPEDWLPYIGQITPDLLQEYIAVRNRSPKDRLIFEREIFNIPQPEGDYLTETSGSTSWGTPDTDEMPMHSEVYALRPPRLSAADIYQQRMAEATIPREGKRVSLPFTDYSSSPKTTSQRMMHFPLSQRLMANGRQYCSCHTIRHCDKLATLHGAGCDYCDAYQGVIPVKRYYPSDAGWYDLRDQVRYIKNALGIADVTDV